MQQDSSLRSPRSVLGNCRALSDTCYSRAPSWVSASAYHVVQDFTNLVSGVSPEKLSSEIEDVILEEFEDVEVSCMFPNGMDPSNIMCTMQLPSDAVLATLNRAETWTEVSSLGHRAHRRPSVCVHRGGRGCGRRCVGVWFRSYPADKRRSGSLTRFVSRKHSDSCGSSQCSHTSKTRSCRRGPIYGEYVRRSVERQGRRFPQWQHV